MGVWVQAKERVAAWLKLGAVYDISQKKPATPKKPEITPTDFRFRVVNGRPYLTIRNATHISQLVIFPGAGDKDKWKCAARSKLIDAVDKMYTQGWFDVSPVRSAIDTFKLQTPPSVQKALEDLHSIHCVHFKNLTMDVFNSIPRHLTHIFTEGRIPAEAVERVDDLEALQKDAPNIDDLTTLLNDTLLALEAAGAEVKVIGALRDRQTRALGEIREA